MVIPLHDDNPTTRLPVVTVGIIAVCVFVYFFVQPRGGVDETRFTFEYAAIPCELRQGKPLTEAEVRPPGGCDPALQADSPEIFPDKNVWLSVIFSMFMHGSILHLAGNMLFLWIFGNNVEEHFWHIGYVVFYVVAGIAAMGAHYLLDPSSTQPVVGASGAIAGVMGAYLVLWPRARVLTLLAFLFLVPVYLPAGLLLAIWFGSQFLTAFNPDTGVAWLAHVGGFAAGALIALALRPVLPPKQRVQPAERPDWGWGR